jgi:ribose transport system ATP-binding protein
MPPLLSTRHIAKRFGTTVALADVSLDVAPAEVHAVVGENGAGKSTLMRILAGADTADAGQITFAGQPFAPRRPADALAAGIAMIYQEFNLAPHLSVEANLLLGRERRIAGLLLASKVRSDERAACEAALSRLGLRINLDTRVGDLGVADQQMTEVARAILADARLVIMDEPTSALAAAEVQRLFAVIRQLKSAGVAIVYISHFLEELEQIADRVTVIRDGRTVATGAVERSGLRVQGSVNAKEEVFAGSSFSLNPEPRTLNPLLLSRPAIVRHMVGRDVTEMYPRTPHTIGPPLLTVRDLTGAKNAPPRGASLTLHRGEILGVAGLVGAGRTETLRALFGLDPRDDGAATLDGVTIQRFTPADWTRRGVGLLSEDRKSEGLAQSLSSLINITLPASRPGATDASNAHGSRSAGFLERLGFIPHGRQRRECSAIAKSLKIKWSDPDAPVSSLSGGNQQKVALARLLYTNADVLLLDEPTRGIDVGAKVDLYRAIGHLAATGKAILMVSSYLPELLGTCDRIAVMSRGRLTKAYDTSTLTPEKIMELAVG